MRTLLLLRGAPGCGKSTFIKKNELDIYTIEPDRIRLLFQSPVMGVDGTFSISQKNDKDVWKMVFDLLERRMQKGCFTVLDATNSKTADMNKYKILSDKYKYRVFCVDFTDVPIEDVKRQNKKREEFRRVPERVITDFYERFKVHKVPSGIEVIKPSQLDKIWFNSIDLSQYKKIVHIGDIHGCYTVLQSFITKESLEEDTFYIFLGDYIDRGTENSQVVKFILEIKD